MTDPDAPAMIPLAESPWLPLYREAAAWIPANHDVVDLACGTGRFLSLLVYESPRAPDSTLIRNLVGIDFSPGALNEAAEYLSGLVTLVCEDLREWQPNPKRRGHTTYTCLEVLEHLDNDCDLVRRVPPGHQFVFSVPSYESKAHLRWFRGASEAAARYGHLIDLTGWRLIRLDERKVIHLFDAVRRTDTW